MPESIFKLQPDRTVSLRGFDSFASAASIHSATPTGFNVSGTFRDPADFAVAVLYDADNFYEHPSIKHLPDFNFAGLKLTFSVHYTDGLQPLDSPKYDWIDWAKLDCVLVGGSTSRIRLWDHATLAGSTFPAATTTFNITSTGIVQPLDRVTLWYMNTAFDYTVAAGNPVSAEFMFYGHTTGTTHSVTINGATYTHTEVAGETSEAIAAALIDAINTPPNPDCIASAGSASNAVAINVRPGREGVLLPLSASDGNASVTISTSSPALVAQQLVTQINAFDWIDANALYALMAAATGAQITVTAARCGTVNVTGNQVTAVSGAPFTGLNAGCPFQIAGTMYQVASVQSPTSLTLSTPAPSASGVAYLAPRGGRDGNMLQLYGQAASSTLAFNQTMMPFTGGSSDVVWNCEIDFTALGIDQLRQCWLTFAPSLANGAAMSLLEWQASFSNWQITAITADAIARDSLHLKIAGPGSIRIEESDSACQYSGTWTLDDKTSAWYSQYYAKKTNDPNGRLTVTYTCQFEHDLYVGTSLYGYLDASGDLVSDRAVAGVQLNGDTATPVDCRLNTGTALITRRLARSAVPAGEHTVCFTILEAGNFYFDFLEAAVRSDVPAPLAARQNISPALDFDTDHTYKLPPARLMWMMDQLGYAGPMNEYLGVFWWNERKAVGRTFSQAQISFTGTFAAGDAVVLNLNGTSLYKTVFPQDTLASIAQHFAFYINETFVGSWASASPAGVLTVNGRSPAPAYTVDITVHSVTSAAGFAALTLAPVAGLDNTSFWVIDTAANPPMNRATRDWHADFYAQCATRNRAVTTALSMELVYPPDGFVARFPDALQTPVSTATGFGNIVSNHCAIGSANMLAYQKSAFRAIGNLQSAAGLTPSVQFGEFLWWFEASPSGMAYYDDETKAAARLALGRDLHVFLTTNDDPQVNSAADALFLRNRLRDHVAALVADFRSAFATGKCEVLWPCDVNYPKPLTLLGSSGTVGGQLNRFINLPVEWQAPATSGLDRMKVEALAFGTGLRSLDLAREAIDLFPGFGWPVGLVSYLVPVFGQATPWTRELALVWGAGLSTANLWAFDHICLFNLRVPERTLERRSILKGA